MRVGVVMPTYNQAQWLPGALASVAAQGPEAGRARGLPDFDLVIVDDGSTDDTDSVIHQWREVRSSWRETRHHEQNCGTAEAINTGVSAFTDWLGPMRPPRGVDALTWVSSDNVLAFDCIDALAVALEKHGAGAAYGGFYYVTPERVSYLFKPYDPNRLINDVNCYFGPAFLIRKDVWLEAGPHRGRISHDYDHWLRVEEVCWKRGLPIVGVDVPLCWYNAHDKRVTVTRTHEFDAHHWQNEARKRRGLV